MCLAATKKAVDNNNNNNNESLYASFGFVDHYLVTVRNAVVHHTGQVVVVVY